MMELLDFLSHDLYVICRSRVLVTGVPVQTFGPTKYFDGLPDSFLKHVVFSRKDQGGDDIQGLCSVFYYSSNNYELYTKIRTK